MNERFEELLKRAWALSWEKYIGPTGEIGSASPDEFYEKFAELIVQECARIADVADENSCEWIGGNILTYFGVKQRTLPVLPAEEQTIFAGIESSESFTIEGAKKTFGVKE